MKINNLDTNIDISAKITQSKSAKSANITQKAEKVTQAYEVSISNQQKNPKAPSGLTYTGHGRLEMYPENMSITYVVAHEQKHAQRNRMMAFSKGEQLQQNIKYSISFRGGKLVATGGVTQATFSKSSSHTKPKKINIPASNNNSKELTKKNSTIQKQTTEISRLKMNKESLQKKLNNSKEKIGQTINTKNVFSEKSEEIGLKQQIGLIDKQISEIKTKMPEISGEKVLPKIPSDSIQKDSIPANDFTSKRNDHITYRNISELFQKSNSFAKSQTPNVQLFDHLSSTLKVNKALGELKSSEPLHPLKMDVDFNPRFLDNKVNTLDNLRVRLENLHKAVHNFTSIGNFNNKKAESSNKSLIEVSAGVSSSTGTHNIIPTSLSTPNVIVSDSLSDPYTALNLSGSVKINGYNVTIKATDSLYDIKNIINRGEDLNNNGSLDLIEDLNGNGTLDIITVGEGENKFFVFEDIDNDRIIDPSEDLNNNNVLDGGSLELGVYAEIENGQLILTSLDTEKIILTDNNNVFSSLGFLTNDINGQTILKHDQNTTQSFGLTNIEATPSRLNVDGVEFEKKSNTISDIIDDVTIRLKESSSKPVKISINVDVKETINIIENFVKNFNSSINFINDHLEFKKTLKNDPDIQRIRTNLIKKTRDRVKAANDNINKIEKTGIDFKNKGKKNFSQNIIDTMMKELKTGFSAIVKTSRGSNSVFSNLNSLGIMTKSDDTLSIDTEKLQKTISKNIDNFSKLFLDKESGIAARLDEELHKLINKKYGTVPTKRDITSLFIADRVELDRTRKGSVNAQLEATNALNFNL